MESKKIDFKPISLEEIEESKERIHRLHPMAITPLDKVFPGVSCCLKCCVNSKSKAQYKQLLVEENKEDFQRLNEVARELGVDVQEEEEDASQKDTLKKSSPMQQENQDPYLNLGFGIVAYFRMLKMFILVFLVFSILSIPAIAMYSSHNGQEGLSNYSKSKYSLGNMGFSDNSCSATYVGIDRSQKFQCKTGKMTTLFSYGIVPTDSNDQAFCGDSSKNDKVNACNTYIDKANLVSNFTAYCLNQQVCTQSLKLRDFVDTTQTSTCTENNAIMYLQYFCTQDNEDITVKRREALVVGCIGIFICLTFLLAIYYLFETSKLDYKLWDVDTVTAADFTVETFITQKTWDNFLKRPEAQQSDNKIMAFEMHFRKEVERIVSNEEGVLTASTEQIKIDNITFAFNNVDLLRLLQKRGRMIATAKLEKLQGVDAEINAKKETNKVQISRPVAAFVTFETQEGYERACNLKPQKNWKREVIGSKHRFLDEPLFFEEAPEPTNIIWEHRDRTFRDQTIRKIIVIVIVILLLLGAFIIFYILKSTTVKNSEKYPPTTDCASITGMFGDNFQDSEFATYAASDKANTLNKKGTGIYYCYCKNYEGDTSDPICSTYKADYYLAMVLARIVSFSIVFINTILRTVIMMLIQFIGYYTESEQTKNIKTSIFITCFFNTAILLLLTGANTGQTFLFWLPFEGSYPDLTYEWYNDIGSSLIITMLTAAFWPIIEFFISWGMKITFRWMDRGFSRNFTITKCKTIQQFVNLYSGPDYLMHFKYAGILNVTFVTFMYGLAIPLLFPIACIYFCVTYMMERLCITYYYKKPPMYDEKLNESALATLKWAPVFMMIFGYWIMGNRQIFHNSVTENDYKTDPVVTDHKGYNVAVDSGLPLLIFGAILFVLVFFNDLLLSIGRKIGVAQVEKEDDEVDEQLGTYNQCLGIKNRKVWRIEELHMRKNFGIKTISDEQLEDLKSNKRHHKMIRTCPNYEITTNPKYAAEFQYTPVDMRDTQEEKENSDMVLKMLKLAYFTEDQQNQFKFKQSQSSSKIAKSLLGNMSMPINDNFEAVRDILEEAGKPDFA